MASAPPVSTQTMFDWHAKLIERAAYFLAHQLESTDPSKQSWAPPCEGEAKGRSALEQVGECIQTNRMAAVLLRGGTLPKTDGHEMPPAPATAEAARAELIASAKEFAEAVRGMSESDLGKMYALPFAELPGAVVIEIMMANMHYHAGQIAQIQMMCGDPVFHVPPEMMQA